MAPFWADMYKLFNFAYRPDPISRKANQKAIDGVGVTQPDAIPDIRADNFWGGGGRGAVRLRDSNDFIDLSSVTNRQSRYKEYERLLYVSEIDAALTIFADECCVAGDTQVSTPFGSPTIKELAETKKPDEKFLVYCYDFTSNDYTLGWAYNPRKVRTAETTELYLDNGERIKLTPDHRILLHSGRWIPAGELKEGDELMPFYRLRPFKSGCKSNQFPRIYTHVDGWKHERQFVDEWRLNKKLDRYMRLTQAMRRIRAGLTFKEIAESMKCDWDTVISTLIREGFTFKEVKQLYKRHEDRRRVIGISKGGVIDVYDLSVDKHENFATNCCIVHNCQKGDNGHLFDIKVKNASVKKEAEFFFWKLLKMDRRLWNMAKKLFQMGDLFLENVIDPQNPSAGILKVDILPSDSMYRIETTKGKLLEFQQSKEGPDYQSLSRVDVTKATEQDLAQATALRFAPEQIVHMKVGDDRKTFYPYGVSLIEPARGPAHQLRLMEDSMVVYRLCLVGDTRVRTTNGYKYLKDIVVGDKVWTFERSARMVESNIIYHVCNGKKKVYTVKSQHNKLTGTATHPALVMDKKDGYLKYVDFQDLKPKQHQMINVTFDIEEMVEIPRIFGEKWAKLSKNGLEEFKNKKYENITELLEKFDQPSKVKQFLYAKTTKALPYDLTKEICKVFDLNQDNLVCCNKGESFPERINIPKFVDEDFARLFGFILGDGSIRSSGVGKGNQLYFASGLDEELNAKYANLLVKYFGKVRYEPDKRRKNKSGNYVVDSKVACRIFYELGYIPGAKNKRIPQWAFRANKSVRRALVEGLSDADGCERYTKAGLWFSTIELCNKQLVEDIKELWHSIGLCSGHIKHRKRNGGHEIEPGRIMKPTESWNVTITARELPLLENIISVEEDGEELVYDVTVDNEEHNFIVNGVPCHQTRAPERRVFYIDTGSLPPNKVEAMMERMKDQLRKKKVYSGRSGSPAGASSVEERWHAPAADEDIWLPTRPNSNSRIETLPGAQNLGEIDDAVYFRNKLLIALNMPKNYLAPDDPTVSQKTLSSQDVKFARMIERLQMSLADGMVELLERHLRLRGFPQDTYDDLEIAFTPPSEWREMSRQDILTARYGNASSLKGAQMMADYDIYVEILKIPEDKAREYVSRNKMQKVEDAKIQAMIANPELLGVGQPGGGGTEMGGEAGGPSPMLGGETSPAPGGDQPPPPPAPPAAGAEDDKQGMAAGSQAGGPVGKQKNPDAQPLPNVTDEEVKKYDLEIKDYSLEKDDEELDQNELGEE
jgi:intein/homing endonuclease